MLRGLNYICFRLYRLDLGIQQIILGEFDDQGKYVIDHDDKLLIICTDIRVSET